ncbi:MAG: 16S rRNA (cytidine(1402)-2'-O)-methyltransferase [Rickettsiales bacterium]
MREKNQPGELFVVATPIGNLGDITLRALEVLKSVDRIACEDTRTSGVLMQHYGIRTPLTSYHDHNEATATATLVTALQAGGRIALISDAGTPLLSDPGARLVAAAIEAGIRVTPLPGASALLAAISIAGLPAETFFYAGFLSAKTGERAARIAALSHLPATLVFYEAPHRLCETLAALNAGLGPRPAAVARELTKLHEECVRGSLPELMTHFTAHAPRGECVIVVAGAAAITMDDDAIDAALHDALTRAKMKEAVAEVATLSGRAKSDIYARALALKASDA